MRAMHQDFEDHRVDSAKTSNICESFVSLEDNLLVFAVRAHSSLASDRRSRGTHLIRTDLITLLVTTSKLPKSCRNTASLDKCIVLFRTSRHRSTKSSLCFFVKKGKLGTLPRPEGASASAPPQGRGGRGDAPHFWARAATRVDGNRTTAGQLQAASHQQARMASSATGTPTNEAYTQQEWITRGQMDME
jgi:hypothetical protein